MAIEVEQQLGGLILCGGESRRMGSPKHLLTVKGPSGPETFLERMVRIVSSVTLETVVVAGRNTELPPLSDDVIVVRDEHDYLGPLAGIARGLPELSQGIDAAFITGCDTPLLKPEWVPFLASLLREEDDAVVPFDGEFEYPLSGIYRLTVAHVANALVGEGTFRLRELMNRCRCCRIDVDEFRTIDPALDSIRNINTPEEFAALFAN